MSYSEIRSTAEKQWDWLENLPQPLIQLGMGTCGRASGADDILRSVQQALKDMKLLARTMEVGCIGMCYLEPLMAVRKPGKPFILYGGLTPEDFHLPRLRYAKATAYTDEIVSDTYHWMVRWGLIDTAANAAALVENRVA